MHTPSRPIWPSGTAALAALLLLLLVALQARVVFAGRSLIQTNYSNPLDWRPTPASYGPNLVPHDEWTRRNLWPFANIRDPGAAWWQWEPGIRFLQEAMRRREWPLWNPYIGGGTPAMANLVPTCFFPPFMLMVAAGAAPWLQNAYFLLLLFGAALFTALLIRQHDLGFWPSLAGGALVLTSGAMNQTAGSFLEQTLACLPVTLYATRLLLDRPVARRASLLAVVYAAAALSSFPPLLAGVFGMTALYALAAIAAADCRDARAGRTAAAAWWLTGTALAVGLVAALYLPALALGAASPQVAALYIGGGLTAIPVSRLLQLLSPTIFGGVQVYLAGPFATYGQDAHIPYVGVACLGLAFLAHPGEGRRRWSLFVASCGATALFVLKLVGAPPVQWIGFLPKFDQLHYAFYLGLPLSIGIVLLAAFGLDALMGARIGRWRAVLTAAVLLIAVEGLWRVAAHRPLFHSPAGADWIRDWRVLAGATSLVAGVMVVAAVTRPARRAWIAGALILTVAIGEGLYNTRFPKPMRWNIFDPPLAYVQAVTAHAGSNHVFPAPNPASDTSQAFDIRSLGSLMAYNAPRLWRLYHETTGAPASAFMREPAQIPPEPLLDRAGVTVVGTYTQSPLTAELVRRGYRRAFDDGFISVFTRDSPGRARFVSEYRLATADEARSLVTTLPGPVVVLEEPPGVPASPGRAGDPGVTITDGLNRVRIALQAPRPGLVYLADSYMPGWSATVNGSPVPILAANYAFRAVAVPAGPVEVEFRYWPPGLSAGLTASGISLAIVAALAAWPRRREDGE